MCLAIPGQVEEMFEKDGLLMGKINVAGIRKNICLHYTPDACIGDYVLVHVGFALGIIDEKEAKIAYENLLLTGGLAEIVGVEE